MALRPKLEFFRFKLESKEGEYKTFRDFAIEELYQRRPSNDAQIMNKLYEHFINSLVTDKAKVNSLKKQLKLIKNNANKYLVHSPKVDVAKNIVYGVINGGRFGRDGMMSDSRPDVDEGAAFGKNKTILRYYYFLLYLPLDYNEGCFIIHSNSKQETITDVFKMYVSRLFRGENYRMPTLSMFCPLSFQHEFQEQAFVKSLEFKQTCTDHGIFTNDGIHIGGNYYDVKIEIIPHGDNISLQNRSGFRRMLQTLGLFRGADLTSLADFNSQKMTVKDSVSKSDRTFNLSDEEIDIIPVVYLENRIKRYNDDGTPNFVELNTLCQNLLQDEVLPELRPDLYENEQ